MFVVGVMFKVGRDGWWNICVLFLGLLGGGGGLFDLLFFEEVCWEGVFFVILFFGLSCCFLVLGVFVVFVVIWNLLVCWCEVWGGDLCLLGDVVGCWNLVNFVFERIFCNGGLVDVEMFLLGDGLWVCDLLVMGFWKLSV